jgi:hypothetical protein
MAMILSTRCRLKYALHLYKPYQPGANVLYDADWIQTNDLILMQWDVPALNQRP